MGVKCTRSECRLRIICALRSSFCAHVNENMNTHGVNGVCGVIDRDKMTSTPGDIHSVYKTPLRGRGM